MIDQKSLPVPTFVNTLSVSGFLNGNVNMLLTVMRWYLMADADGLKVAIDEVV